MNSPVPKIDTGICVSLIASAVIHLAVFLLLVWWGRLYPPEMTIQETYYVDVVNLPVADARAAAPEQTTREAVADTVPPPPPVVVPPPVRSVQKAVAKNFRSAAPQESAETESAFAERIAKIERNSEARREEAVLDKLRTKVKAGGSPKTGMPGAVGAETGSRYSDYIKSRLEDALKITSSYTTKSPEVAVRLTISADGRLSRMKIEQSSGDATFELAVRRAIDLASEKFTPPPNRTVFENGFIFRPKGISNGTSR